MSVVTMCVNLKHLTNPITHHHAAVVVNLHEPEILGAVGAVGDAADGDIGVSLTAAQCGVQAKISQSLSL